MPAHIVLSASLLVNPGVGKAFTVVAVDDVAETAVHPLALV